MKKICMIVPSFTAKGGISSVVNGYKSSELESRYDIKYIETYTEGSKFKKLFKAIKSYIFFIRILFIWNPDIIHIHSSFGASFYRKMPFIILSAFKQKKIINHIHGSEFDKIYTNTGNLNKKIVWKAFDLCDKIIVLSEEWKRYYKRIIPENKLVVVENYSCIKNYEKQCNDMPTILFLGFLSELKGCYDIPLIAKKVNDLIPNVRFILAGEGNPESKATIVKKIEELNISENIIFTGWVRGEKKDSIIKSSDIFLLPSYTEAMPMSILECMGYGKAIISTNIGAIPQLVTDDINGYLFNPGDIDGFSNALIYLLQNKDKLNIMGENSKNIVKNKYSLEMHLNKLFNIYEGD